MVDDHNAHYADAGKALDKTSSSSHSSSGNYSDVSVWTFIGEICAATIRTQFRFERDDRTWYEWRGGTHWVEIRDTKIITDILHNDRLSIASSLDYRGMHKLRDLLSDDSAWRRETRGSQGEWWASLRMALTRPPPSPPTYEIATPGGVVDIRTGEIAAHDPSIHDSVAVTSGNYRPQEMERLKFALWDRLQHNLDIEDFEQLIAILAVAVARRCPDRCSVLWLAGKSGSGKSTTPDLIMSAFGDLGLGASESLLARRSRSDIDADMAQLLQIDPIVIAVSEVEQVSISRLLALSGGDVVGVRRPHGTMQRGKLSGLVIATSVEAPKVPVDTGLRRRVAVLPFPQIVEESVVRNRSFSQDELDAVVTLSIQAALDVGRSGWTPPHGNVAAKDAFLAEADPVADWLQKLDDDWHERSFKEALASYNSYNKEALEPTTSTMLGRRINASNRWTTVQRKGTRRKYLKLIDKPLKLG